MNANSENSATSFPLSPEQQAVLSMRKDEKRMGTRAATLLVDITGALDPQRLKSAVEAVVRAHGSLHSTIGRAAGFRGLRQKILEPVPPLSWRQVDPNERAGDDPDSVDDWVERFHKTPLPAAAAAEGIEDCVPVQVQLLRISETQHVMLLAADALAADGGSLQILYEQVVKAYTAETGPDAGEIFQYMQFVEWRRDLALDDEAAAGRAYWDGYIAPARALTGAKLAYRSASSPQGQAAGRTKRSLGIETELASRVNAMAARLGCRVEFLLQAVWWLLLGRLTGEPRFMGGWQHDCRRDYEVMRGSVGVFEKVLPVVVAMESGQSFPDWLGRLAQTLDAHVDAQEYWAVDEPAVSTHLDTGFLFHDAPADHEGAGPAWRLRDAPGPMACFELALQLEWGAEKNSASLATDTSRYPPQAADRLLLQFSTLLESVVNQPDALLSELPVVGSRERGMLLAINEAPADFGTRTLAGKVAHWGEATPDAPVVESGGARLTYREFNARINRMARWLAATGVAPGSLVALNLPRSLDLLVSIFAVWRAGACYLPLEPDWPVARRKALLFDAQPALVLHAAPAPGAAQTPWREVVLTDVDLAGFADTEDPGHEPALDGRAYVLYTSGSTGLPKGVVIEHSQLLNYTAAVSRALKLETCRRWALTSSVVADLGNTALFGALFNGACLVVAGPGEVEDAQAFSRFMARHRIDALKIVPSHLEALLEHDSPCLPRTLVLGGEAASRTLMERITRLAPQCRIHNHYGPTETTVGVMVHSVSPDASLPEVLPLSRVLANNRVYVLDGNLRLVPAGAMGDVYVGGAQVCRSYLNREVEGAFIADPFQAGERLYRTGDLACALPEGGIRLAGRADHQVKIRGFRVELAEVESCLLAQPGVRQAAALARPDRAGTLELEVFLVADAMSDTGRHKLRERMAEFLPAHMLPARYTWLEQFPRLPNGKVDRVALMAAGKALKEDRTGATPMDDLEFALAGNVAKLIGRESIGIQDDFFELGAHSLMVIKLVARIRKLLQMEVAPGVVFDHPTVAALAAALRAASANAPRLEALAGTYRRDHLQSLSSPAEAMAAPGEAALARD